MTSLFINLPNLILNLYRHILFTFLTKVALRFMFKKKKKTNHINEVLFMRNVN